MSAPLNPEDSRMMASFPVDEGASSRYSKQSAQPIGPSQTLYNPWYKGEKASHHNKHHDSKSYTSKNKDLKLPTSYKED
ncbi:hypothetical protein O181_043481 [Austropuccinia psidii MF-1]|uniref:Uncharacterized protein n=1 Tax=Austropuccinia psidii MF-1 TaxID=1389203 RepID=A0A9Q3DNK9_9BASI|nr:hypothetical protein [Austropuccinia psidii MF-1]